MAAVIDTLEIAHELREAGVPELQAEAIARQFKRRYEADRDELVTRAYLDNALERQSLELRGELERQSLELRGELDRQSLELRGELERQSLDLRGDLERQSVELRGELERQATELRADIARLGVELRGEIARHAVELRGEIAQLERDLILKLGGIITLAVAVIGALGVLF